MFRIHPSNFYFSSVPLKMIDIKRQLHTCVEGCPPEACSRGVHAPDSVEEAGEVDQAALPPLGRQVGDGAPAVLLRVVHLVITNNQTIAPMGTGK